MKEGRFDVITWHRYATARLRLLFDWSSHTRFKLPNICKIPDNTERAIEKTFLYYVYIFDNFDNRRIAIIITKIRQYSIVEL